ncbi:saccharopine dehydrogenase [Lentzea cavernae]|uniref:Saccharopine dehydrogenase n=1 Tax=Lentzea cavernae TaxID=2020703 RepID=A0ABQ3MCV4_9PSEU|nr:saccharopine dehydrogenase [Lentzea cavernae]GHH40001.1 saccharopine dehydrogenase [Lentzea cavernae]
MTVRLWMRSEVRPTERRAPITPADAASLVSEGFAVTVEESAQRVHPIGDYAAAGCTVAEAGGWVDAPDDFVVVGLKELPDDPSELRHRHVFFGHAYKKQEGAERLLRRFDAGGGVLLDLEYLTDDSGRRLAAFGYWAGYVGAALAVLHHRGALDAPLRPTSVPELDALLAGGDPLSAVVIGALGRCGRGADRALTAAGVTPTRWDLAETRDLDRPALLRHEVLVNAVLTSEPIPPFLRPEDLDEPRALRTVCDVTCDVGSPFNVLPIYDSTTSWDQLARALREEPPLDLIAIDNLPSLVPLEATDAFSADLLPLLRDLPRATSPWQRAERLFHDTVTAIKETSR